MMIWLISHLFKCTVIRAFSKQNGFSKSAASQEADLLPWQNYHSTPVAYMLLYHGDLLFFFTCILTGDVPIPVTGHGLLSTS